MTSSLGKLRGSSRTTTTVLIGILVITGLPILLFVGYAIYGFMIQSTDIVPIDVKAVDITKNQATISWQTPGISQGVVEYGTNSQALNSYSPEVVSSHDHAVKLTLLSSATTYYFQLRVNDQIFDDGGVPWTFTTKTKDGSDAAEAIKGIMTRSGRGESEATESATFDPKLCGTSTCEEVQKYLGKGCTSQDYLKCISRNATESAEISSIPGYTPIPTPSPILIVSNLCNLSFIQAGTTCSQWLWDGFDTKPQTCRNAFDRYVLQCKNTSFTGSSSDAVIWYYNGALTQTASNSATLKVTPKTGATVHCQVRAEDAVGGETHATPWVRGSRLCE